MGSPVKADSSIIALGLRITPATAITSPARTRMVSPSATSTMAMLWSRTSHPTMPTPVIAPEEMDHLIAYLLSLRAAR